MFLILKMSFSQRQIKQCLLGSGLRYLLFNIFLSQNVLFFCRHKTSEIHICVNTAFVSQSLTLLDIYFPMELWEIMSLITASVFRISFCEISGKETACVYLLKELMEKATLGIT